MSPKSGEVDGCGTGILVFLLAGAALVAALLALVGAGSVFAEERGPECHTTQTVLVACVGDKATVNWTAGNYWEKPLLLQVVMGGQATMVPLNDRETTNGTFETDLATLAAGEIWFVWSDSRGSWTEKVTYEAHSCVPTALTLSSFSASSAGNRGGCAPGNKLRGLACTVTAFTPGYVSGECDGGYWFSKVRTARTFRLDQSVTAQGCIGIDLRLTGAAGWPLRISK